MTPFPLDGGRAGDGGGSHQPLQASDAIRRARRLRSEMTGPERLLWAELRKLPHHVRRQAPIGRYIADFAIREARLIIELDGPRHDLAEAQLHDEARDAWFEGQGYRTLRFTNAAVLDQLNGIVAIIHAAAHSPPSPTLPPSRGKGAR